MLNALVLLSERKPLIQIRQEPDQLLYWLWMNMNNKDSELLLK